MEGRAKKRRICENDGTAGGASSTHSSTEGQGTDTSPGYDYEVFLSFRGPDTRAGFTDFLYTCLNDTGIRTFKDDEELRVGEEFAPELLQAINQSKISIPIFSKGYASSVWCLKELVQMVECQKTGRQKIKPIFYDVAPSEVRYQKEGYAEAFLAHIKKKRHDEKTIQEWKDALGVVGALNGWDLHSEEENRREGEFAKKLTKEVFSELKKAYLVVSDCLVSVDNHVDAIMEMIGVETSETRIIGIHGMGGIGKATIAKVIYNQLSKKFEGCCFLSNVRETSKLKGIHHFQHQLISDILNTKWIDIRNIDEGIKTIKDRLSNKRVLLLLDDVEEKDHMNALVGKRDWFGRGSKLIITTRKKDVLKEVDCTYEVNFMDDHQSLQLFSKHAFRRDSPLDEYINQSHRAIRIAGGLPLALAVIGSLLSGNNKKMWDATLKMLESVPDDKVQSKLKISYDALNDRQKHIFLDIACIFIGYDKDFVVHFWDESKFPEEALEVLQNMSLIKIGEHNKLWMHDQLRDLGREMVRQESKMKIEKQCRVWDPTEALKLLRRHEGETKVEALRLHFDHERQYCFTYKDFKRISNLRFLQVNGSEEYFRAEERLLWHESPSNVLPTNVLQENSDLLSHLRWLSWHGIPPTFNITNFSMEDVVILDLSRSKITHDWQGWSHMKVMKNLKILNLTGCDCLERTPIFSAHSNLERLSLNGCNKLVKVDESICQLKSLVSLDLGYCGSLQRLPDKLGGDLASLEYLTLNHCRRLDELPNTIGNLESLIELHISGTGIEKLPDSIGNLKNLKVVRMGRNPTKKILDVLWTIEKLEEIDARDTIEGIGEMAAEYMVVEMDARDIITPGFDVEIGDGISRNRSLRILGLEKAEINALPRLLPESLIILELSALRMHTFPNLSNLTNLKKLKLRFVPRDGEPVEEYEMPRWTGKVSKLECLLLASPQVTVLPTEISLLPRLRHLYLDAPNLRDLPSLPSSLLSLALISDHLPTLPTDCRSLLPRLRSLHIRCPKLGCLPSLPSSLSSLALEGCRSCCSTGDISNLKELSTLKICDCAISEIRGLDGLQNLFQLWLVELPLVEIYFDLSNSNKLRQIDIADCSDLVEIQGKLPPTLSFLYVRSCGSLRKLPDLSNLKRDRVHTERCEKVDVDEILCSTRRM